MVFVFGLQTLLVKDLSKIYQLNGLQPKNKGHINFYECCDLTKKVCLMHTFQPHQAKVTQRAMYIHTFRYIRVKQQLG